MTPHLNPSGGDGTHGRLNNPHDHARGTKTINRA